jgi:FtsZ-binding cell division protein ZapB
MGHQPPMSPTVRSETVQNPKIQTEIEVLTMESQHLKKESERLQTVIQITMTENRKMKNDNQTLLKAREELVLTSTKFMVDQDVFQDLICHWRSKGEEVKGRIDQLMSENERLYSENQQLIEANQWLAIDGQNLQVSRSNWTWP